MAGELIQLTDGVAFHELRRADGSIHSWIRKGFFGPADYRGRDDAFVDAAGYGARPQIADSRTIEMGQFIRGSGATEAVAWTAFLALADELTALYEATQAQPRELRVYSDMYGIPAGFYRKLNVRWVNTQEGQVVAAQQLVSVRFVCIDSPPNWETVAIP